MADRDGPNGDLPAKIDILQQLLPASIQLAMPAIPERTRARHTYEEFFEARISNPRTSRAYKLTVDRLLDWCDRQGVERPGTRTGAATSAEPWRSSWGFGLRVLIRQAHFRRHATLITAPSSCCGMLTTATRGPDQE